MIFLGIDVSKAKLDCCLLTNGAEGKLKSKVVPNTAKGYELFLNWLEKHGFPAHDIHAIIEATGVYHEQLAQALADNGVTVSIVNPAQIKDFGRGLAVRTKNDRMDSRVLARYGALVKPRPWQPPSPEVRILKALLARQNAVSEDLQRERNRLEKAEISKPPQMIIQSIKDTIVFHEQELKRLEESINDHIDNTPDLKRDMEFLTSIPSVGPKVGSNLLAIMHTHQFNSAEQVAAYLGLVPVERQSGSSIMGRPRLSKAGPAKVRSMIYMAAIVAIRFNPHIKAHYERLLNRGKSKMSALGAAMRKLVHLCYGVLNTRCIYQADYAKTA